MEETHLVSPGMAVAAAYKRSPIGCKRNTIMKKFTTLKSIPAYLSLQNIDTDMIIPKQFLKQLKEQV